MRQTGQCPILPAPTAGAQWLCVLILSVISPCPGGRDIPRKQLNSGISPTCFTLKPGCGHFSHLFKLLWL